jgi:hypothetical protein
MSKMKKFFVVALGVVLGFALVGSAYAIDTASLESQTTEGLYDRNDAFDHALDPALLYQLDRWRLYTNLSGYSGHDDWASDSYLIGTSGKLGPGSLALFYETNKFDRDEKWFYSEETLFYEQQDDSLLYPRYDRVWDERSFDSDQISAKWKEEENNFHVGYGMDFDGFSLGVTYAPEFMRSEYSLGALTDVLPTIDSLPTNLPNSSWTGLFSSDWFQRMYQTTCFDQTCSDYWMPWWELGYRQGWIASLTPSDDFDKCNWWWGDDDGSGTSWNWAQNGEDWIYFDNPEHVDYAFSNSSFSFHGKRKIDRDVHPIEVGSHIRVWNNLDLLVRAGYASINEDSDVKAGYNGALELGEHSVDPDPVTGYTYDRSTTFDFSMNVDGALADDYDADRWSIFLSPTYVVNDMVSVRVDLGYSTEDGDTKGGVVGILDGNIEDRRIYQYVDPLVTDTDDWNRWNVYEKYDLSAKGSRDEDHWSVEPRVYLTFDKVNFALGAGYEYIDQDWKCNARRNKEVQYTYYDSTPDVAWLAGDPFPGGNTWTLVGSWTGEEVYKGDAQVDIWTFPVATEFMVTERLTLRAGASYTREHVESKQKVTVGTKENEQWTVYSGAEPVAGNERIVGPAQNLQSDTDVVGEPFDDIDATWHTTNKVDETYDYTTYNLGLGYAFTENLQMDLMWAGKGESGGVDMTEVFASVTLAF